MFAAARRLKPRANSAGMWRLDDLEQALGEPGPAGPGFAREERIAGTIAAPLTGRRALCELLSSRAPVPVFGPAEGLTNLLAGLVARRR